MSPRIKVLQVGKFYPPYRGGMETYLENLCQEIKDRVSLEVVVANTGPRTVRETIDGVRVTRVASLGRLFSTSLAPTMPLVLSKLAPDIVHIHHPNPLADIFFLLSRLRQRTKLVISWHSDVVRQRRLRAFYTPVCRAMLERADAICVATPNHLSSSDLLPAYAAKCRLCSYGVDLGRLAAHSGRASFIRDRFRGRPLLLGVGRLVYYKGFDLLIEAARGLEATLLLIGEGPLRRRLERQIERAGLRDRVFLLGEQPDVASFFAACDVFVLPSTHRSEAFGFVQLEAMAFGKPVLSTRLGTGVDWVNQDGVTGLVVAPGNADELREALRALLRSPELRARLGASGRARVERHFTKERAGEDVLRVYTALSEPRLTAPAALAATMPLERAAGGSI